MYYQCMRMELSVAPPCSTLTVMGLVVAVQNKIMAKEDNTMVAGFDQENTVIVEVFTQHLVYQL